MTDFRSGFVGLIGRPNVGKSTLMNRLVGQVVAIATHRAQTTRRRVRGILNRNNCQMIFIDTPGLHLLRKGRPKSAQALNRYMISEARAALAEVDLVLLLVEAQGRGGPDLQEEDHVVLKAVRKTNLPCLLAINKIDALAEKQKLLPLISTYDQMEMFQEIIPLSARTGEGVDRLIQALESRMPQGPQYFPEDMITDEPERLLVAEFIREQVLLHAGQEIPYQTAVDIESFEDLPDRQLVRIHAFIYVQSKSQKGILIGKGGSLIKSIGTASRKSIESLLGCEVYLDLRIKLKKGWSRTPGGLRSVGYKKS
jgi:GTP-binding protein Era